MNNLTTTTTKRKKIRRMEKAREKKENEILADWEQIEQPVIHQKDFDSASYMSPHFLIISWFFS